MVDQTLLDRVEKQAWFHRYPRGWPFLLFILASIGTAMSVFAIERANQQRREVELDRNLTEIAGALQRRVTENIALLRAGSALFAMHDDVSREQISEFSSDLQASGNFYGSLGLGWAPLIPLGQTPQFEVDMRENLPGFSIWPDPFALSTHGGKPLQYSAPIVYLEPGTRRNQRAIGYDMYSDPVRRAAMNLAIDTGKPVASGKVVLMQDQQGSGPGFMIYMAVSDSTRGGKVKGLVYTPFRAQAFLQSVAEMESRSEVEVSIYDESIAPENLLAERRVKGVPGASATKKIDVGNHTWIVRISEKKVSMLSPTAWVTLLLGIIISLMLMAIGRLITRRAAEDRRVLEWLSRQSAIRNSLTRELNHRVKNTLANVLSIAALTRRRSTDIDEFTESLTARIRALSATHDLLSQSDWSNASLGDIVRSELAPYMAGKDSHVSIGGPTIMLAPHDAMSLGLAIHELATNAAKYGALSTAEGRIYAHWAMVSADQAELHWREEGGPPVSEPNKRGFGRDLIEKIVAHELRSEVDLKFLPSGVECRLKVPVREAREFFLRGGAAQA